jgi:UDP-N-acetylmuramoylalanine--D-glutamate ligase
MPKRFTDGWLRGKRAVVMGLGRFGGGVGVTRFLCARGADVRVTDRADEATLADSLAMLADLPVAYRLGGHDPADLDDTDLLVVSPAVDRCTNPFFLDACARGIPCTTEINLFLARCRARMVGVTGTIGKSTTCAMAHAICDHPDARATRTARKVLLGGNIGASLLEEVDKLNARDLVVLELSSFQLAALDDTAFEMAVAGVTNVQPHHLDRHGTFAEYLDAKLNLPRHVCAGGSIILGSDDPELHAAIQPIATERGAMLLAGHHAGERYALRVPGAHNQANAHLAVQLTTALGIPESTARAALAEFTGLPHRLEFVATHNQVSYYNDSKSTAPAAVRTALAAFGGPIIALCGGKDIGGELDHIVDAPWDGVRAAICFGDAGPRLASLLRTVETRGSAPAIHLAREVPQAVAFAQDLARAGDVVVFTPGCPSYDAFPNYEARGEAFRQLIRAM